MQLSNESRKLLLAWSSSVSPGVRTSFCKVLDNILRELQTEFMNASLVDDIHRIQGSVRMFTSMRNEIDNPLRSETTR